MVPVAFHPHSIFILDCSRIELRSPIFRIRTLNHCTADCLTYVRFIKGTYEPKNVSFLPEMSDSRYRFSDFMTSRDAQFVIKKAAFKDRGVYTCNASNGISFATMEFTLRVRGMIHTSFRRFAVALFFAIVKAFEIRTVFLSNMLCLAINCSSCRSMCRCSLTGFCVYRSSWSPVALHWHISGSFCACNHHYSLRAL